MYFFKRAKGKMLSGKKQCGSEAGGLLVSISDATSADTGHQTSSCVTHRSLQYLSHTQTCNYPTVLAGYHAPQNEEDYRCIKVNDSFGERVRLHHYRPRTDKQLYNVHKHKTKHERVEDTAAVVMT